MNKIDILIKGDKFGDFISKLEDLAKINDVVRIQINNEDIYVYSVIGDPIIQAFKNFILKTDDYFDIKLDDDKTLELTISDIKKFIKKTNFIDTSLKPKMSLHIKEDDDFLKSDVETQVTYGAKVTLSLQVKIPNPLYTTFGHENNLLYKSVMGFPQIFSYPIVMSSTSKW